MIVYAESSAVLAWLLGESAGSEVRKHLGAEVVVASELTLVECDRSLRRAVAQGLPEATGAGLRAHLARAANRWNLSAVSPAILARARGTFPVEPIRTLDALHLASALHARSYMPDLAVLALDRRIRENAGAMGFPVFPVLPA